MKILLIQLVFLSSILLTSCNQNKNLTADQLEVEREMVRKADIAWAKTGETRNLDAQMELYSDDQVPVMMPPNGPKIIGKDNIRAFLEPMYNRSDFNVTWYPEEVEVAKSGELAYVIGVYESQMNDAFGNVIKDKGKYIEIWRKQKDGIWKCSADILNSDLLQTQGLEPEGKKIKE